MLTKIKELFAGWSAWVLIKKLAGRYVPVAVAGSVAFFSKWAPEGSAEPEKVQAAVATVLWLALESARNAAIYALRRRNEK